MNIEIDFNQLITHENVCFCVNQKTKKELQILQLLHFQAVRTGLEPATSCVTGRHSNQLNYRTLKNGNCNRQIFATHAPQFQLRRCKCSSIHIYFQSLLANIS